MQTQPSVSIAPASTVVLLREGSAGLEVLLVQRARELAFHGGEWVFPGGRVDPVDGLDVHSDAAARAAAVRETHEEAGVVIAAERLVPYAHWTTPEGRPRRFATWFFLAPFDGDDVVVDGGEIHAHRWFTPADALLARKSGEIGLPPPTFVTLTTLAQHTTRASALAAASQRIPDIFVPRPRLAPGAVYSLYEGDAAYEGGALDAPGARHRLIMEPADYRYERHP